MARPQVKQPSFVKPAIPTLATTPPHGPDWIHEVKMDGWRVQLHKSLAGVDLLSRNGRNLSGRFRHVLPAIAALPATGAILDGELVAVNAEGLPDFRVLHGGSRDLVIWVFDLLWTNGEDLRALPLTDRRWRLHHLMSQLPTNGMLRLSEAFDDPDTLLAAAERMGLEGIVSKRRSSPYRSGLTRTWLKIKTTTWREANRDRGEMFAKRT